MGGSTNRRRKDDRRAELHRFTYWLETEYGVSIEWEYKVRGMLGESERAIATAVAVGVGDVPCLGYRWEVSGEILVDRIGMKELQAHMEILSRLMMDLQMERMYGIDECEYAIFSPAVEKLSHPEG
jgi:hypothetical protein